MSHLGLQVGLGAQERHQRGAQRADRLCEGLELVPRIGAGLAGDVLLAGGQQRGARLLRADLGADPGRGGMFGIRQDDPIFFVEPSGSVDRGRYGPSFVVTQVDPVWLTEVTIYFPRQPAQVEGDAAGGEGRAAEERGGTAGGDGETAGALGATGGGKGVVAPHSRRVAVAGGRTAAYSRRAAAAGGRTAAYSRRVAVAGGRTAVRSRRAEGARGRTAATPAAQREPGGRTAPHSRRSAAAGGRTAVHPRRAEGGNCRVEAAGGRDTGTPVR